MKFFTPQRFIAFFWLASALTVAVLVFQGPAGWDTDVYWKAIQAMYNAVPATGNVNMAPTKAAPAKCADVSLKSKRPILQQTKIIAAIDTNCQRSADHPTGVPVQRTNPAMNLSKIVAWTCNRKNAKSCGYSNGFRSL